MKEQLPFRVGSGPGWTYVVEEIHPDGSRTVLYPRRSGWWLCLRLSWDALWASRKRSWE